MFFFLFFCIFVSICLGGCPMLNAALTSEQIVQTPWKIFFFTCLPLNICISTIKTEPNPHVDQSKQIIGILKMLFSNRVQIIVVRTDHFKIILHLHEYYWGSFFRYFNFYGVQRSNFLRVCYQHTFFYFSHTFY